jgi:hypothetical protein
VYSRRDQAINGRQGDQRAAAREAGEGAATARAVVDDEERMDAPQFVPHLVESLDVTYLADAGAVRLPFVQVVPEGQRVDVVVDRPCIFACAAIPSMIATA